MAEKRGSSPSGSTSSSEYSITSLHSEDFEQSSDEELAKQIVDDILDITSPSFIPEVALLVEDENFGKPKEVCSSKSNEASTSLAQPSTSKATPNLSSTDQIGATSKEVGDSREDKGPLEQWKEIFKISSINPNIPIIELCSELKSDLYTIEGRRFLAHQVPAGILDGTSPWSNRTVLPNVINLMDSYKGPLSALAEAKRSKTRLKIWTKEVNGYIRGYSTGFLVGFDKHWNLLLQDVDETYQRKRLKGSIAQIDRDHTGIVSKVRGSLPRYGSSKKSKDKGTRTNFLIEDYKNTVELFRIGIRQLLLEEISKNHKEIKNVSNAQLRKKRLVILRRPIQDYVGNKIIARSKNFEIVESHLPGSIISGNTIGFIETGK